MVKANRHTQYATPSSVSSHVVQMKSENETLEVRLSSDTGAERVKSLFMRRLET